MIYLTDDYLIGFDQLNIILYKKINGKGGNRKQYKDNYYNPILFFSDFKSLLNHLVTSKILISSNSIKGFEDIIDLIEKFTEEINKKIILLNDNNIDVNKLEDKL